MSKNILVVTASMSKRAGGVGTVNQMLWQSLKYIGNIFLYELDTKILSNLNSTLKQKSFYNVIKTVKPTVIHFHGMWNPQLLFALIVLLFSNKIRLIITPHGMLNEWALKKKSLKKNMFILLMKFLRKKYSFQALTKSEKTNISKYFPNAKISIIGNPVDSSWKNGARNSSQPTGVVSLGRLGEQKNSLELCDAILRLESKNFDLFQLSIFGWSDSKEYLEQFSTKADNSKSISYRGELNRHEVLATLSQYKFFLIFSNFEGFPMTVLEALTAGCVVIGNDTSGLDDISASNNVHVIPGNLDKFLAGAVSIVNAGHEYDEVDKILDEYTPQRICSKLLKVYGEKSDYRKDL